MSLYGLSRTKAPGRKFWGTGITVFGELEFADLVFGVRWIVGKGCQLAMQLIGAESRSVLKRNPGRAECVVEDQEGKFPVAVWVTNEEGVLSGASLGLETDILDVDLFRSVDLVHAVAHRELRERLRLCDSVLIIPASFSFPTLKSFFSGIEVKLLFHSPGFEIGMHRGDGTSGLRAAQILFFREDRAEGARKCSGSRRFLQFLIVVVRRWVLAVEPQASQKSDLFLADVAVGRLILDQRPRASRLINPGRLNSRYLNEIYLICQGN